VDRAIAADSTAASLERQARTIVAQFDAEIAAHFAIEERILFPVVESSQELGAVVGELRDEHARLRALIESLRSGTTEVIPDFTALLRAHVRKEETVLFEEAQRLLPRDELDRVGEAIGQHIRAQCIRPAPES
jgi:hemerythrin-like domain-containing protein